MLHSCPTPCSKFLSLLCPFCIFFSLCPHHCLLLMVALLCLMLPLPPDFLKVLQRNADGLQARGTELLYFFCCISLTLSVSRNPILTHLPLFGFLVSPLCALIAPTPNLAFPLVMQRTPAAASSFLSGRAYPFLNFLLPLFLRFIPTLIM